jgi:hypothetical protein
VAGAAADGGRLCARGTAALPGERVAPAVGVGLWPAQPAASTARHAAASTAAERAAVLCAARQCEKDLFIAIPPGDELTSLGGKRLYLF